MSTIEMYKPEYEVIDIFNALKNLKRDELLDEKGPFEFFYHNLQYPGVSLYLKHNNRIKFFYIDHDDFMIAVKDQAPRWDVSNDNNLFRIILIYKIHDSEVQVNFVFDLSDKNYVDLLKEVSRKKEIKLYFLTMLYGGLVFDSYCKIKIPHAIIKTLKKIK